MKSATPRLLCVTLMLTLYACSEPPQLVSIRPEKPGLGDELTIRYNPQFAGARLAQADAVAAHVFLYRIDQAPLLLESPMRKQGNVWEAKLALKDPKAVYGLVRFVSDDLEDTNHDAYWDFMIHGKDGKPVQGAHLAASRSYANPPVYAFVREKNLTAVREHANQEEALHPDHNKTQFQLWEIDLAEKGREAELLRQIGARLDVMAQGNYEDLLQEVAQWYAKIGQPLKAVSLEKRLIGMNPKSEFAQEVRFQGVLAPKDSEERAGRALVFLQQTPNASTQLKATAVRILIRGRKYREAEALALSLEPKDGDVLNGVAWTYIDQNIDVARGVELAKVAVEVLQNDPTEKPSYYSELEWQREKNRSLGNAYDTYGVGLFKLGRDGEAQEACRKAYDLAEGSDTEITEHLLECYLKNGDHAAAIEVTAASIEKSAYNDKLLALGKEAFIKKEGSSKGLDALVERAQHTALEKAKSHAVAERLNKPAPDFQGKTLSGETIQLSALRGKVVVLDFWATWCGPCKAAFPYVQKIHEKYRNNAEVVLLAVNTFERETGAKREELVKKFIAVNHYTFSVVYDEGRVAAQYGVDGIPTQFFIDRQGNIQFREVGFPGPQIEPVMATRIDALLSDELASSD